ncbi:putative F-box/FBD/LRR-repeat protein At4g13965 [Nicotiana tabacum]|uniref:F-box/FBD/LRR-repeat protein At4g13965 n=1 Tax=Nicotiana tabacum TaxID=4097 RepID=A0AC58S3Y0_TOBAC
METSLAKPKALGASITGTSEGIDRISYLPDEILHNILSFLYIFDVVQLSISSKRWNYICRTMPYLHFDIIRFGNERVKRLWDWQIAEKFKDYQLGGYFPVDSSDNKAKCCHLPFDLPYCVVTCESLQVLKLQLSGDMLKLPNHLGFCQLKLLHLVKVELSNEHLTMSKFLAQISKVLKYGASMAKDIIIENPFSIEVVHIFFYDPDDHIKEIGMLVHKMIKNVHSTSALKLCMSSVSGLYVGSNPLLE